MAIALAILHGTETDSLIILDAETGIRNYRKGCISAGAARALNAEAKDFQDGTISTKTLKWFPAHMGDLDRQKPEIPDSLNERAHRVARRLTHRDTFREADTHGVFRGDPVTAKQIYMTTAIQDNTDLMLTAVRSLPPSRHVCAEWSLLSDFLSVVGGHEQCDISCAAALMVNLPAAAQRFH
ncbi:hypothetical protein HPB50_006058 [Hyalomma asiaticum]|uniref:Uncharacterized protein n=1 Tax=Hyalomma asiaticum TaxID=266040 RepID=A0ACB7SEE8_HYAAI|nr:hypothetical protein HPB50_006058 [Hyalomma asiaticum]